MRKQYDLQTIFGEVETTEEHKGYTYSVGETLTVVILGSFCGLRNVSQIHQWATNPRIKKFLINHFEIYDIPSYYWMLCLLKLISPKSLNECFIKWVQSLASDSLEGYTLSFDGKTVRSTGKMSKYDSPMHIVSAHIAELGITFGQETVYDKSNEIPAMRSLLDLLSVEGCVIVADAMHCQKETAKAIVEKKADYVLNVKGNQPILKQDISDYIQDPTLRKTMNSHKTLEKNRGRIESRTGFTTTDIDWLYGKSDWSKLACIGAINTQVTTTKGTTTKVTTTKGTTDEWHYYISSRKLTAAELLKHARLEWSVESMHWLLDVHFGEDFCRIEDKHVQQNLNMVRKIVLNTLRRFKDVSNNKRPFSKIMLDCMLEPLEILNILLMAES